LPDAIFAIMLLLERRFEIRAMPPYYAYDDADAFATLRYAAVIDAIVAVTLLPYV